MLNSTCELEHSAESQ